MSKQFQPTEFSNLSDADKQLIKIYAKSTLASAAVSLVSDSSLRLKEVNLDESVCAIIDAILKDQPETNLRELVDEALIPLQAVTIPEDLNEVAIPAHLKDAVRLESREPKEVVARLEREGMRHLHLDGGVTIQRFLEAKLINELTNHPHSGAARGGITSLRERWPRAEANTGGGHCFG